MKICLINPKYAAGQRAHRIPLGLSYIAATLITNGYNVEGYNLDVDPEPDYSQYDYIGIYVSTPNLKEVKSLINKIKSNAKLVLGGPHISAYPDFAKEFNAIAIQGEGEQAFLNILKGDNSSSVKLDDLPFPAKEVFDHGNYKDRPFAYAALIASRGCPFRCKNCQPGLSKISPYRNRLPEHVVDEMHALYTKYAVKDFSFEDSELIISKPWTLKLCSVIHEKFYGKKITFQGNARLHQLDDEVLSALKKVGCRRLGVGIESGSQRVIEECLNKDINLNHDLPKLSKVKKYGIESQVWIMIGIPGETEEDIKTTIKMVKQLDVSTVEINIATPWPGTYFYSEAKEKGWLVGDDTGEFDEKRKCFFSTPFLKPERVQELFITFKEELLNSGWVKWSHETNTYARKPNMGNLLSIAINKIKRGDIRKEDFGILRDWITKGGNNKCQQNTVISASTRG